MEQELWFDHCPFLHFGTEEGASHPVFALVKLTRQNEKRSDLSAKLALNQAAPKADVGGKRRVCVITEICMK